jgi:ATP-dependent protease Clp ATPase subunit
MERRNATVMALVQQQHKQSAGAQAAPRRRSTAEIISSFDKNKASVRIDKSNIIMLGPTGSGAISTRARTHM